MRQSRRIKLSPESPGFLCNSGTPWEPGGYQLNGPGDDKSIFWPKFPQESAQPSLHQRLASPYTLPSNVETDLSRSVFVAVLPDAPRLASDDAREDRGLANCSMQGFRLTAAPPFPMNGRKESQWESFLKKTTPASLGECRSDAGHWSSSQLASATAQSCTFPTCYRWLGLESASYSRCDALIRQGATVGRGDAMPLGQMRLFASTLGGFWRERSSAAAVSDRSLQLWSACRGSA
ncbi:hypothetical protein GGR56DRAFT_77531 [Xylariaceae sp. FL0804]|nr:hypothetical protein GGR56DRAFT_77531 [Xylariaceae sp. FL0804]